MGVERCSSLASTGRYRTQGLNQVKEFEKLLYRERDNHSQGLSAHLEGRRERTAWLGVTGRSGHDAVSSLLFLSGLCDVETTSLQRGIELSRYDHYGLFLPRPLPWYSALPVGMFYAQRVNAGEINFSIDTFS